MLPQKSNGCHQKDATLAVNGAKPPVGEAARRRGGRVRDRIQRVCCVRAIHQFPSRSNILDQRVWHRSPRRFRIVNGSLTLSSLANDAGEGIKKNKGEG